MDRADKVGKAAHVNARTPGQVRIVTEEEFCQLAGRPSVDHLSQQFYRLRDIRGMYPVVREVYLRYLEKWGLINPVVRTDADAYYSFADLLLIKQVAGELIAGPAFKPSCAPRRPPARDSSRSIFGQCGATRSPPK